MANAKISALTALTNANVSTSDVVPIVDTDATATKKITVSELDLRWKDQASAAIAASDIDWSSTDKHTKTLAANTTFTFSNVPTGGGSVVVKLIQDATPRTVTWPAGVKWEGGTAPTMSTGSGAIDIYSFVAFGTSDIYGSYVQDLS